MEDGVLAVEPVFGFYTHEQLRQMAGKAYLYVHCAWVEVEGLSCLEALREGAVPVIGEGEFVATSQFALTPQSLYPLCDSRALAARLDWWIEHPEDRARYSLLYARSAEKYNVEDSISALIKMYETALG